MFNWVVCFEARANDESGASAQIGKRLKAPFEPNFPVGGVMLVGGLGVSYCRDQDNQFVANLRQGLSRNRNYFMLEIGNFQSCLNRKPGQPGLQIHHQFDYFVALQLLPSSSWGLAP